MKKILFFGSLVCLACFSSCDKDNDNDNNNSVSSNDRNFVMGASLSNTAEVMAGQLAATKGTNTAVKAFGQMMVTEHGMAQSDLRTLGSSTGIQVSDTVDAEHQALMTRLNSLSGYSFDTAYINAQVMDHQKTLNMFNMELSNGNNTSVRNYAAQYQPHIQMHLQKADSIRQAL